MKKVFVNAYAKINLGLNILRKNGNFHDIDTVMSSIDIYDIVTIEKAETDKIIVDGKVADIGNTVCRALRAFQSVYGGRYKIVVDKNIPYEGGLGGSSADAAGVLYGLSIISDKNFEDVKRIGKFIGSDLPFMMEGGICRVRGKGEIIDPINYTGEMIYVLIVKPKGGVLTKACYDKYDEIGDKTDCVSDIVKQLSNNQKIERLENVLFKPACSLNPEILPIYEKMKNLTKLTSMSGSGSSVFGLFYSKVEADYALKCFSERFYTKLTKISGIGLKSRVIE